MPQTDHLALCSKEVRHEFTDLFNFAKSKDALAETAREHYGQRFAADPDGTRRQIDLLISGAVHRKIGTAATHVNVREMPGYPSVDPGSDMSYPSAWLPEVAAGSAH